ncbi:MAG TPA: hypothetical protein EYP24_04105 [bacterium (Candidatus Stahlbacteria)]|nr:hypothetical protein [Candidatus Stahlbacteria bacterium]
MRFSTIPVPGGLDPELFRGKIVILADILLGRKKIEGFDPGNSPYEYRSLIVAGKTLILTTNRTMVFDRFNSAESVLIRGFLNLGNLVLRYLDGRIIKDR